LLTDLLIILGCLSALAGGAIVLFAPQTSRNLLGLFVTAFSVGVLIILMGSPFVGMVQLIIYAGAIVMLFLFVIRYFAYPDRTNRIPWLIPAVVIAIPILIFQLVLPLSGLIGQRSFLPWNNPPDTAELGQRLFMQYLYPFELISVLLLVAVVGAIFMAREDTLSETPRENE
jgi:NADH-quinone oxidoreductase subunit J